MRKRNVLPARQVDESLRDQASPREARAAIGDFEPITWLALLGTLVTISLTVAFTSFDPMTALLGQFP